MAQMGLLLGEKEAYTITIGSTTYTIKGWNTPDTAARVWDITSNLEKGQTLLGWKKISENPSTLARSYEIVVVDENGAVKWQRLDIEVGKKLPKITWTKLSEILVEIPGVTAGPKEGITVTYTQREGPVDLNVKGLRDNYTITIGDPYGGLKIEMGSPQISINKSKFSK